MNPFVAFALIVCGVWIALLALSAIYGAPAREYPAWCHNDAHNELSGVCSKASWKSWDV
jgi:hypothetical protein